MPEQSLRDKNWESHLQALEAFKKQAGHCNVSAGSGHARELGRWLHKQRARKRKGLLPPDRVARLEAVGVVWDLLDAQWEARFADLQRFKESSGHCDVPRHYAPDPGLAVWLQVQRREKRAGKLKPERLSRLEALGVVRTPHDAAWERSFAQLAEYREKYGHCDVGQNCDEWPTLPGWLAQQRATKRRGKLSEERAKRLEELGVVWEPREEHENALFAKLEEFNAREGHGNIPESHPVLGSVGAWITAQRIAKRKGRLSAEKEARLAALGVSWDPHDALWEQKFKAIEEFKKREGHCEVTADYREDLGLKTWLATQRYENRRGTLSAERHERLDRLGLIWEPAAANADHETAEQWDEMIAELEAFACREGHCNVPVKYPPNPRLGRWLDRQRQLRKQATLSSARIAQLEAIGVVWSPKEAAERDRFAALEAYKAETGHCNVPSSHPELGQLGVWLTRKRIKKQKGELSASEVAILESLGIEWSPHDAAWEKHCAELRDFISLHGHSEVPASNPALAALASWLSAQRRNKREGKLVSERCAQLEALGISWDPVQQSCEEMFAALEDFKRREGHCNVPYDYADNPALGKWLSAQRSAKKRGTLAAEARDRLDALGVLWNPRWEGGIRISGFAGKACSVCGEPFVPTHGNARHCSAECYMSASTVRDEATGCMLWKGGVDSSGRAHAHWNGKRRKAHIFAYELAEGAVPSGKMVRHRCNNARCCNPEHLQLGTHAENMSDKAQSGIVSAENNPHALLTNVEAVAIYEQRSSGDAADVAKQFGVPLHVVRRIWNGESYVRATGAVRKSGGRPAGETNPAAKCSNSVASEIYAEKDQQPISASAVARKYNVSAPMVRNIWSGKTYSSITGARKAFRDREKKKKVCVACQSVISNAETQRKYCSWKCALEAHVRKGTADDCWLWTSKTKSTNYGQVIFCSKREMAHIVAFDLAYPELSRKRKREGLTVSHTCHNALCCNPAHLTLETNRDNAESNRGRADISGESHNRAKLNVPTVQRIKTLIAGGATNAQIRDQIIKEGGIEVTGMMIADIRRNRSWRTVAPQ